MADVIIEENEEESAGIPRRKIIIVDDVNYVLATIKARLQQHYEIYPAQNAEVLYELLDKIDPEMIIMDVQMPEYNGFELIQELKADKRYEHIPVMFLSGNKTDRKSVYKGMSLGAVDFLTKPISNEKLVDCIESHLDPKRSGENTPIILAVDDNPSILQTLNHLLSGKYKVYTLPQPQAIVDVLAKVVPDLFILDCHMPVMHGFELVPLIRSQSEHEDTPIIFLTSEGTIDNVSVATSIGASGFIVKPIEEDILMDKVASVLIDYISRRRIRTASSKDRY